jgi:transcriptional regulator NrdR family protein
MSGRRCPRCQSKDVNRSHRKGYEKFLVFWRMYRCDDCQHRFAALHLLPDAARAF